MQIEILEPAKVVMQNRKSNHNYFGWPTIARLKNGRVMVGASGFRLSHICPFGKACVMVSENDGQTYTLPTPIMDTVLDDRDTGLCPFGESGLIVTSFNFSVTPDFLREKLGEGWKQFVQTEAEKQYVLSYLDTVTEEEVTANIGSEFRISMDNGVTFGEIYKSPVTSPHGPIELQDGTILWVGQNYKTQIIEAHTMAMDGTMTKIGEIAGATDSDGQPLISCEPYAIQLRDGTILCQIRTEPEFSTFQSESHDGGKTWSTPHRVLPPKGGAPAFLLEHSSGVLISAYGYREQPYGIRVLFSTDKGQTWESGHTIYETTASDDLGYPSMIELENGSILTVFYATTAEDAPCEIYQTKWCFTAE